MTAKPAYPNVYLKPGKAIPFQKNLQFYKTTTDFQTKLKTSVFFNRDTQNGAQGTILIDDGISASSYSSNSYT